MLLKFPPEILASIVAYPGCIITLWKCGDRILHSRLSSIVSSLTVSHIPMADFAPPKFLSQLPKLKELTLSSPKELLINPRNWDTTLKALPSTLKSLTIDSSDSHLAFVTNLRFDTRGRAAYNASVIYCDIGTIFPHLTSLTVGWTNQNLLSALPPGLTSLTAPSTAQLPFMSLLPRSMKHFNISVICEFSAGDHELDDSVHIPPGMAIQHLTLNTNSPEALGHLSRLDGLSSVKLLDASGFTASEMKRLPSSLATLQLPANAKLHEYANPTSVWPSNLTILTIECAPDPGILSLLPRHIKVLRLRLPGSGEFTTLYAAELPPLLVNFNLRALRPIRVEGKLPASIRRFELTPQLEAFDPDFLPDSLEECRLDGTNNLGPIAFPPRLQKLSVSWWDAAKLRCLPSSLTDIRLLALNTTPEDHQHLFSLFPTSLKSLSIHDINPTPNQALPFHANDLPSLTSLQISYAKMPMASIEHLPRSLTSFRMNLEGMEENPTLLASLPPNLVQCKTSQDWSTIEDLGELLPPKSWRCLVGTPVAHHVRRLRQRLEASQSQPEADKGPPHK